MTLQDIPENHALASARRKAYWRLLPLLFICYVIAYVDRANVSFAKLTMQRDLPHFDNAVIGFGAGIFFIGYFLLEIPGTIIVEKWSARKWISRIMISWGIVAGLTSCVHYQVPVITPVAEAMVHGLFWTMSAVLVPLTWISLGSLTSWAANTITSLRTPVDFSISQFYGARFLLGLAEAGFFPGVIVYLTHWFPKRDRARALAIFMIATPAAQLVSPKICNYLLKIGSTEVIDGVSVLHPTFMGLVGWQWLYIAWGIPAVVLGFVVLYMLPDHPRHAKFLTTEERESLERELAAEHAASAAKHRMTLGEALAHPKVLLLALAYLLIVTGNYGIEFFLPSILQRWYNLKLDNLTWLVLLPPLLALLSQVFVGWNSDRTKERRLHSALPGIIGGVAMAAATFTQGNLPLTIICFMVAAAGTKAYLPAFWALPSMFLTATAAAGSIGLINSVGNLGGFTGPYVVGQVEVWTGSFFGGLYYLAGSMVLSSIIILALPIEKRDEVDRIHKPVMQETQEST